MAEASAEKLEHDGPAEKERVASAPQRKQLASTPELSLPTRKGTGPSIQSTKWRGGRESQGKPELLLGERGGSKREHGEERWIPQ